MAWLETLKLTVYAVALAYLLHELTHYVIALLCQRHPSLIFDRANLVLAVDHDAGERLTLADHAIHAGPLVIGLLLAAAYLLAVQSWPTVWLFAGWATYTLVGAPNDLSYREVEQMTPLE